MTAPRTGSVSLPRCARHASCLVDHSAGKRPIGVPRWTGKWTGQRHDVEQPRQLTPVDGQFSAIGSQAHLQGGYKCQRCHATDIANVAQVWAGQGELPVQDACQHPLGTVIPDDDVAPEQIAVDQGSLAVEHVKRVNSRVDQLPEPLAHLGVELASAVSVEQSMKEVTSHAFGQPVFTWLNVKRWPGQPARSRQLDARQAPQRLADLVAEFDDVDIACVGKRDVQRQAFDPLRHQRWVPSGAARRIGQQDLGHRHNTTYALGYELLAGDSRSVYQVPHRQPLTVACAHIEHGVIGEGGHSPDGSEAKSAGSLDRGFDHVSGDATASHVPETTGQKPSNPRGGRDHGVVVMAYGSRRYLRQAWHLMISVRRHSPGVPVALVTDRPADRLAFAADLVIPLRGAASADGRPKLDLDIYSPFKHTLYLDADSLVVRDIRPLFERFGQSEFVVLGRSISDGHWYGKVAAMCALAGSDSLPKFNGGILYFTCGSGITGVFTKARELASQYAALGYDTFNGGVADEPLLAIALAQRGIEAQPVDNSSVSLLGITSSLRINALNGHASFEKKYRPVTPSVVHFAADFSARFRLVGSYYRRECLRLRLAQRAIPTWLANSLAQLLHGLSCALAGVLLRRRATSDLVQ